LFGRNKTGNGVVSANDYGGEYYRVEEATQPWDYIAQHNLNFFEGNVVKYITRWRKKGNISDLRKLQHYVEKLIEIELNLQSSIKKQ